MVDVRVQLADGQRSWKLTDSGLFDFACRCLACAEDEARDFGGGCWAGGSAFANLCGRGLEHIQLCGLGGNLSLEISWRDMMC